MSGSILKGLACCAGLLLSLSPAHAGIEGEGRHKFLKAQRVKEAPIIDGRLTEAIWSEVAPDDRFTQHFPLNGAVPSMRTTIRVAFDDENLYFGIEAEDPDPAKISARLARRDSRVDSDFVEFFLDTRHNHDTGYWFRVNAAGVLADGELHDDSRINYDWDAVWTGKAAITDSGWNAEIAIPLSALRFPSSPAPQFGLNIRRGIRRLGEIDQWIYAPRTSSGTLSRAGHITGLGGLVPKRAIELRPFSVVRPSRRVSSRQSEASWQFVSPSSYVSPPWRCAVATWKYARIMPSLRTQRPSMLSAKAS
ncbi:MAG: carbohydrate binding family 9 domain-containing protein [Myxococcales bacterium]|nr:carbohydrate binding family 9 domain-containing protein [Myxococcales bacterium]